MNPSYLICFLTLYCILLITIVILLSPGDSFTPVVLSVAEPWTIGTTINVGEKKKRTVNMNPADFRWLYISTPHRTLYYAVLLLRTENNNTTKSYMDLSICAWACIYREAEGGGFRGIAALCRKAAFPRAGCPALNRSVILSNVHQREDEEWRREAWRENENANVD